MTSSRFFLWLTIIYLVGFLSHAVYLQKTVYGDGIFYYSWLRSAVVDHDTRFANEYAHFGAIQPTTSLGILGNKYSIGPALLWAPAYISTHELIKGDGYTLPYQLAVGLVSTLSVIFALILLYRLLEGKDSTKLLVIGAIAAATNLIFYGSLDVVNSHGLSFFVCVVYLSLLRVKKPNWIVVGAALAFLSMIRLQDAVFALLLLPYIKRMRWQHLLFGFCIAFVPQLYAWNALYGNFWTNPYLAGGEGFTLLRPHILGVLFYKDSGLFLWTPMVALGVIGLWAKRSQYVLYLSVCIIELWLVASWSTWWQGASYSGRMFVSILPLIAYGLSDGIAWLQKIYGDDIVAIFIATFAAVNVISITYFLLMH